MEDCITLERDVFSLQGQCLLPAGADLTEDALGELADKGRREGWEKVGLLEYGSTLSDLERQMDHGSYRGLFGSGFSALRTFNIYKNDREPRIHNPVHTIVISGIRRNAQAPCGRLGRSCQSAFVQQA